MLIRYTYTTCDYFLLTFFDFEVFLAVILATGEALPIAMALATVIYLGGATSGGHFNPADKSHSGPDSEERHVGDLGNISANENGVATLDRNDTLLSLDGPNSILGRGVIIHAGADDLTSQPTGAAGARLGIGVIGVAKQCIIV